jgi:hypothetical protein
VSPVKYELGFYIPEDDILHSHRREHLKSYISIQIAEKTTFFLIQCNRCHENSVVFKAVT